MTRSQWLRRICLLCWAAALPIDAGRIASAQQPSGRVELFGFENEHAADRWFARGKLAISVEPIPEVDGLSAGGPVGHAVKLSAPAQSGFGTKRGQVPPDWRRFETIAFWVYRSVEEAKRVPTSTIELQLYEADGAARFWRRVDLSHQGWKQVTLPLRWFRWGAGRVPRWDRIDRLMFWFRDEAEVWIDTIAIADEVEDRGSELSADDLCGAAFPGIDRTEIQVVQDEGLWLITDARALDAEKLATYLRDVSRAVFRDLPFLKPPRPPPCLIVFGTREQYESFPARFAETLRGVGEPPNSAGYTLQGIATSYWEDRFGWTRPVFTHEFVHALVARTTLLDNKGEWLQEGLASRYQLEFHPQGDFASIVRDGLRDPAKRLALKTLLSGERIPLNRHWQAATVVDTLLVNDRYRPQLPALIEALAKSGSTNLAPHIESVLQSDWEELDQAWRDRCRVSYRVGTEN